MESRENLLKVPKVQLLVRCRKQLFQSFSPFHEQLIFKNITAVDEISSGKRHPFCENPMQNKLGDLSESTAREHKITLCRIVKAFRTGEGGGGL